MKKWHLVKKKLCAPSTSMALYYPGMFQNFPYAFLPRVPMHNTYKPLAIMDYNMDYGYNDSLSNQMAYHHIYGPSPFFYPYPFWHFPQVTSVPLYQPYSNYHPHMAVQRPSWDLWPEGFVLRGELHWGRLDRVVGPRRDLPDFVKDDLRRVYGTYPKTDVSIMYQNGEFIVKGNPRVGEQEYKIEKTIIRKEPTPTASEAEDSSEERNRKKKKKAKR